MRILVACPQCARQFDASGRAVDSRFRCLCGATLSVPDASGGHEAAVVRCSACGAPRQEGAAACGYCGADFTLHEQDLHTLCPSCMTRVSDRARYCHHCATPLVPQPLGTVTRYPCPACGDGNSLMSRSLEDGNVPMLECQRCAGLWLGREAFDVILDRARRDAGTADERRAPRPVALERQQGALYRPCPECGVLMHRFNYARRSGIIVDNCAGHGIWFDARELDELLLWVRRGGEAVMARRSAEEQGQVDRERRLAKQFADQSSSPNGAGGKVWLLEGVADLLSWFLD